jgi:hypothetical protein
MSRFLAVVCVLSVGGICSAQAPEMPKPAKEHESLAQFAGEWEVNSECKMPGMDEPIVCKGTESAKIVGGFWLVTHGEGDMMGMKMQSILTLGYNPEKKKYVGTFLSSCDSTLWKYEGEMDEGGKKLTLHTEGPHMADPGKTAKYREVLELVDKDHKTFTSYLIDENGKETKFVTMDYRRKK